MLGSIRRRGRAIHGERSRRIVRPLCVLNIVTSQNCWSSSHRSRSPSRPWYGRIGERISLFLSWKMLQDSGRHARPPVHCRPPSLDLCLHSKSQGAGDHRACSASAARGVRSDGIEAQAHVSGSYLLGCTRPALATLERGPRHRQARHGGSLAPGEDPHASQGFPPLSASDLEAGSGEATNV